MRAADDEDEETQPLVIRTNDLSSRGSPVPCSPLSAAATAAAAASSSDQISDKTYSFWRRWSVCFATCFICFGTQVSYDTPAAVAPLLKKAIGVTSEEIGGMYAAYHLPNCFLVILGGIATDILGNGLSSVICNALIVLGTAVFAFAPSLSGMLIGRMVFGVGSEWLGVVQMVMFTEWFAESRRAPSLALSMALSLAVSRLGTLAAFGLAPSLAGGDAAPNIRWGSLGLSLWMCVFSFALNMVLLAVHPPQPSGGVAEGVAEGGAAGRGAARGGRGGEGRPPVGSGVCASISTSVHGVVQGVREFPTLYWLLMGYLVAFSISTQAYGDFITDLIHEQFSYSPVRASNSAAIIQVVSLVLCPPFGWVVDYFGRRADIILWGTALLFMGHVLVLWFPGVPPEVSCLIMGLVNAVVPAALFPCIGLVVPTSQSGTAFAVAAAVQNITMFILPVAVGRLHDTSGGYTLPLLVFTTVDVIAAGFAAVLMVMDRRAENPVLVKPARDQTGGVGGETRTSPQSGGNSGGRGSGVGEWSEGPDGTSSINAAKI